VSVTRIDRQVWPRLIWPTAKAKSLPYDTLCQMLREVGRFLSGWAIVAALQPPTLALIIGLTASTFPVAAQEQTATRASFDARGLASPQTASPLARAITREAGPLATDPALLELPQAGQQADSDWSRLRKLKPGKELTTSLLHAQVAAPRPWEKVDALPPGTQIIITLKSGVRMEGAFQASSPQDLALTALTGGEQRVPKADVRGVTGGKKDGVVDGLLLGAAIGAGAGVLVGYDRRTFECRAGCSMQIGVTLFTPIGALVGWLTDRRRDQSEVLYHAP
jgi:hypothetical protein